MTAHVLAALRELNPSLSLTDDGAYVRIGVPDQCRLTRVAVERHTRAPFRLPTDLEAIMPAFSGRLAISDDEVTWSAVSAKGRLGEATNSPVQATEGATSVVVGAISEGSHR